MESWKLYCDEINHGLQIEDSQRAHINRFNARFELAKNFQKVELANTTQQTIDGYSSIFAVILAFNAAEKLGCIEGISGIHSWELSDKNLATVLRLMLSDSHDDVEEFLDKQHARKQLKKFIDGESDNIKNPSSVIRNSFAHGSLTVHILNNTSKTNQRTLFNLSRKLLDESERLFSVWVNSL